MYFHFAFWHNIYNNFSPPYQCTSKVVSQEYQNLTNQQCGVSVYIYLLVMLCETLLQATGMLLGGPAVQCGAWPKGTHCLGRTGNVAQGSTPSDVSPARKDQGGGLSEKDAFKRAQDEGKTLVNKQPWRQKASSALLSQSPDALQLP